jgi:hypothetical protein
MIFLGARQPAMIYCRKLVQAYMLVGMYQKKSQMLQTAPARMRTSQQADLIWLVKHLSGISSCPTIWEWVEGHAAERKGWSNCTLPERLNHQANILAKNTLLAGLNGAPVMEGDFPLEPVRISLSSKQMCSSTRQALEGD